MKLYKKKYTDEDVRKYSQEVKSMSQLLKKLGLQAAGGNYVQIKKTLQRLNLPCLHWKGQGWSKDEQLKDWSKYRHASNSKKHLILLRGHQCEQCKNETWGENPIPLEIHHKDYNRLNNELSNLELLCCNCHSFTGNWRGKGVGGRDRI